MNPKVIRTEACPIEELMDVLGGRWKVFILWELIQECLRSGELKRRIPPISQKMLVEQLRELEADGLVERKVFATVPPRVEYKATDLGNSLRDILKAMCHWSTENIPKIHLARGKAESSRR
jgi:DNA-binding HxlR family transcriptional regulator